MISAKLIFAKSIVVFFIAIAVLCAVLALILLIQVGYDALKHWETFIVFFVIFISPSIMVWARKTIEESKKKR